MCLPLLIFFSSPEQLSQSNPNLAQRATSISKWRCNNLVQICLPILKIFMFRNTWLISSKLDINWEFLGKGDSSLFKKRNAVFFREILGISEIENTRWQHFKVFFYRTTGSISTKLITTHPFGRGDSNLFKWGATPFSKGR